MLKFEHTEVVGWGHAIRGMRNALESWNRSDSEIGPFAKEDIYNQRIDILTDPRIGPNDIDLMIRLRNSGRDHRKFMRMLVVYVDITGPLYWWKEFDTYKVGTVANSCSTMHCIHKHKFTLEDFSVEHLTDIFSVDNATNPLNALDHIIFCLNFYRNLYLKTKDKRYWWQMIQLLPSSYNQKRTIKFNYEVLANIYNSRKNHKLDEWSIDFINWIKTLPYSYLITGEENERK